MPPRPDGAPQCGRVGSHVRAAGGDPPPSPARAGERLCPPARTVQATGDSDCGPTPSNPPPSLARAWDRQCHLPGRCPSPRETPGPRARAAGGGPPPSPVRAGERPCPPARAVQATGDSDCGPSPSDPGRLLTPGANGRDPRRDLTTLQPTGPPANLGGRQVRCKGHTPTYSLYTASGRQPRVYTACHESTKMQIACLFV